MWPLDRQFHLRSTVRKTLDVCRTPTTAHAALVWRHCAGFTLTTTSYKTLPDTPSISTSRDWIGISALLANVACWGVVPVMLRGLTNDIDAWTANGIRYPIAALLYWPILWRFHRQNLIDRKTLIRCMVPAFFSLSGQIFWALSFYHLAASVVAFGVRSSIVWTLLAGMIVFSEERRLLTKPRFYLGLIVAVCGCTVLLLVRNRQSLVQITPLGIVLMLVCGILFGFYAVSIRYFVQDIPSILSVGIVANYVSVGTVCLLPLGDLADFKSLTTSNWFMVVLSSILGIALGHLLLYTAVNRLGPSIAASVQSLSPFITATVAFGFLHEQLTLPQWVAGTAIVVGAVILLSIKK